MSKKFALFGPDRVRVTQLIEGVHTIPKQAVEISDELFMQMIQETDGVWTLGEKDLIYKDPLPEVAPDHPRLIAATRFRREAAGIVVEGIKIDTSRDGQAQLLAAAFHAVLDPSYTCIWKALSGPIELTAAQLIAAAQAVRAHVQACFDREKVLLELVASGDYSESMLNVGWPNSLIVG